MNPFAKAFAMQRRLLAAIDRHGSRRVAEMIYVTVMRRGLMATVKLGAIPRPFSHRLGPLKREAAPKTAPGKGPPSDLDADYMLPAAQWAPWLELLTAPAGGDTGEAPAVTFVVTGEASPARDATLAAIRAIDGAEVLAPGATIARAETDSAGAERFFIFLKAGDIPSPRLASALAQAAKGGVCEAVSFDLWRRGGERVQPLLAPGANPTLLRATDYLFSRIALRGAALPKVAAAAPFRPRDWMLGWLATLPAATARGRWRHVSQPLVEAAVTGGEIHSLREEVLAAGRKPLAGKPAEPVTVVLCTRDKGHLTRQVVRRLLDMDPGLMAEVVIVSNGTANPYALQTLADLQASPRVLVLKRDEPFNFSRLSNAGARAGRGRGPLLFLNDDIAPVSEDWLERLEARLHDPDVGAVGPLLLYPDERVQHAGMYLGRLGTAGHTLRYARLPQDDYLFTGVAPREVGSLTGAVLLTPRAVFEALNGFDEQLATHLQDVDYCLRVRASGLVNVFEPASILIHMESASVAGLLTNQSFMRGRPAERERFMERWATILSRDPLHPAEFELEDEAMRRLAGPDGRRPKAGA
jgi:GT2 family glycosyltransferase